MLQKECIQNDEGMKVSQVDRYAFLDDLIPCLRVVEELDIS